METTTIKRFFEDRDETGRYRITSSKTGVQYYIEPIGNGRPADWGSYNPASGKIENKKGFDKFTGSVLPSESIVTEENGFRDVITLEAGFSPSSEMERRDDIHYANGVRPKNGNTAK
jgi:hypothetical protein